MAMSPPAITRAGAPAGGTYCVPLAVRAIADSGAAATLLVLTTVVQIFENFRYHRTFVARLP